MWLYLFIYCGIIHCFEGLPPTILQVRLGSQEIINMHLCQCVQRIKEGTNLVQRILDLYYCYKTNMEPKFWMLLIVSCD